jgi:hypothetical protein
MSRQLPQIMGGTDTYIIAYLAEDQLLPSAQYVQLKCCRSLCIPSYTAPRIRTIADSEVMEQRERQDTHRNHGERRQSRNCYRERKAEDVMAMLPEVSSQQIMY